LASGTQAITGVGFRPKAVVFFGNVDSTPSASIGASDGTTGGSIAFQTGTANWRTLGTAINIFNTGASTEYTGDISSLDADGFTINWSKFSTPTGTATIYYVAMGG
jgi:hypothetical protein